MIRAMIMGLFKRIISDNDNDMGQDNDNGRDQDNDHECNIVQPAGCSQGAWGARRHTGFQKNKIEMTSNFHRLL